MMQKQGLYSPEYEHDACGIGFVVNIHGKRTHQTVKDGLKILANLAHRGGEGSDENTGDGAGMLLQIPDAFFRKVCPEENITLPPIFLEKHHPHQTQQKIGASLFYGSPYHR